MPIAIRVVSQPAYEAWLQDAKKKYAESRPQRFADASAADAATTEQR